MTTFQDGPAKGQTLMLHRAAKFLRVVEAGGKFDALDQPTDFPAPDEKIYAYTIVGTTTAMCHIRASGGRGGFYPIATYKLVANQPSDAEMRKRDSWIAWCQKQK